MDIIQFTVCQEPTGKATVQHTKSGVAYHKKSQKFNANALMTEMLPYRPEKPIADPIILTVRAFFPIPKSKSKWWKEAAFAGYIQHDKKPDYDNIHKQIGDCLEKLEFIVNDNQIFKPGPDSGKYYSDKPRWEIMIEVVPNITRVQWNRKCGNPE